MCDEICKQGHLSFKKLWDLNVFDHSTVERIIAGMEERYKDSPIMLKAVLELKEDVFEQYKKEMNA